MRRRSWLIAIAGLVGLVAVATVVLDKRDAGGAPADPAAFLRSVANSPADGATPEEFVTPRTALVAGEVLTVHGEAVCSGGTRAEVSEDDDEVSVQIRSYSPVDPDPTDDTAYLCIPEPRATAALIELDRPLGERRLVDADTGDAIPTMDAAVPGDLPPGWQHVGTSVGVDDGEITSVQSSYAAEGHVHQLVLRQELEASPTPSPGEGPNTGLVDLGGAYAHWWRHPFDTYLEVRWQKYGYGLILSGRVDDLSTAVAVAQSVP